jgi:hypothetical protein
MLQRFSGDKTTPPRQVGNYLGFTLAKAALAFDFKNRWNADACSCFNFTVRIYEIKIQTLGQRPADGRLARSHQPHQIDVSCAVLIFHFVILQQQLSKLTTQKSRQLPAFSLNDFQLSERSNPRRQSSV